LKDCFEKLFDFFRGSLDLKLDFAVRQVCYPTGDIKSLSDLLNREAKTNSLNATLEEHAFRAERFHPSRNSQMPIADSQNFAIGYLLSVLTLSASTPALLS